MIFRGNRGSFAPKHMGFPSSHLLRGEAAADEDPSQGILFPCHGHRWADLQVAEGVETGDGFEEGLSDHIAKVGALGREKSLWALP